MTKEFLGTGWGFPIKPAKNGQITLVTEDERIRESIWIILGTAKGERMMRPDFGCGIHELVFAVNNAATAGQLADEVQQALIRWETRIEVTHVEVNADEAVPSRMLIEIDYRVRTTNNRFNLVYPFYLE